MTIIIRHNCLAGSVRPGSALDCDACRDSLVSSFGEQAVTEENISRETVPDPEAFHHTTADTRPFQTEPGGIWVVTCTCGWSRSGHYARAGGEPVALRLANLRGAEHEENPDKRCAYCGRPERERTCNFCRSTG